MSSPALSPGSLPLSSHRTNASPPSFPCCYLFLLSFFPFFLFFFFPSLKAKFRQVISPRSPHIIHSNLRIFLCVFSFPSLYVYSSRKEVSRAKALRISSIGYDIGFVLSSSSSIRRGMNSYPSSKNLSFIRLALKGAGRGVGGLERTVTDPICWAGLAGSVSGRADGRPR